MTKRGKKTKTRLSIKKEPVRAQRHSGGKLEAKSRARPVARSRNVVRARPREWEKV